MALFKRQHSLLIVAGVLVVCIAVLAGVNLWFLRALHSRSLHDTAAQSVLQLGAELARTLSNHPVLQSAGGGANRWSDFSRLVQAIKGIEPSLEYVTVNEGDVTLFHLDISGTNAGMSSMNSRSDGEVRIGRKRLATEAGVIPVLTFSARATGASGSALSLQIAMRKDAVQQREEQAARMLGIMFRLSLITLSVALGLVGVLGVWVFRHEMERQRRRRDEEHLAFAGLLADGIIHDVRNPMSSLRLDVQMLEKEAGRGSECRTDRMVELAERARNTIDRIDLVMREFLYVSKPGAREPERFELNAAVRDCLDLLGPRFERAEVKLEVHLSADPLPLMGQSIGLKRAVINVLTNAKQASPAGQSVIVKTLREGDEAVLIVEDQGPGVKKEEVKRLFEMFVTGRPDGIGLGLYLAKAAVENCRGTILADNHPGGGARFTLRFPLGFG
ncbi:MAG: HAMP domain-containing sensor histidine kinase [bacterium]